MQATNSHLILPWLCSKGGPGLSGCLRILGLQAILPEYVRPRLVIQPASIFTASLSARMSDKW